MILFRDDFDALITAYEAGVEA
ncbi:MAG: hypothetical protein JWM58_1930, partial [Rhizobium sp.]|nr:hypothetical protein [Rhizobium sp.]